MLKFKLKPLNELGTQEIQCYNISVSPDLSYISGRTSCYNSILDGEKVMVVNNENKFTDICKVKAKNVKVQGKVKLEIDLLIDKHIKNNYFDEETNGLIEITKNVVEYNGAISYSTSDGKTYKVDNKIYSSNGDMLKINTFSYIEDGYVEICDKKYIADFREGGKPNIIETYGATPLEEGEKIDNFITFKGVTEYEPSNWKRETKFELSKNKDSELPIESLLFGSYNHYITYKGENYYLKHLYDSNSEYIGYGVYIESLSDYYTNLYGNIYENYSNNYESIDYSNIELEGFEIEIEGSFYTVHDSLVSVENNGRYVFIITKSDKLDLKKGSIITAKSNGAIKTRLYVEEDANGNRYVNYLNKKYDVKQNAYKYIVPKSNDNTEYQIIEEKDDDKYDVYINFGNDKIYFKINGKDATPINKIYYPSDNGVEYGIHENGYSLLECDGISIDGNIYKVHAEKGIDDENSGLTYEYVEIIEDIKYDFIILEENGSSSYICKPYVEGYETICEYYDELLRMEKYISYIAVKNSDRLTFYIRNDVFGGKQINKYSYLYDSYLSNEIPFCTSDKLNLSIFKINTYANFKLPIVNTLSNNILRHDIIKNVFAKSIIDSKRSNIVDMEKDVYYPVWKNGEIYEPINNIRFNLHFRTRQLDNWKVIEDYAENENNYNTNWFITDYEYYKNILFNESNLSHDKLHNSSDLMGYLGFSKSEMRNRAKKIGKSFLRLSFFSTMNPQTQVLLGTSTIFIDDAMLAKKVLSFQESANAGEFIDTLKYQYDEEKAKQKDISEYTELSENVYFNDYPRLSSRINVFDKHLTNCSSEGFYFYMFREYANNLRPLTIYLKIDFNHAGYGITAPFMLPRIFDKDDDIVKPLYIHKSDDLKILKDGFKLKDIYKQLYIPINVIFDDKTNKYVYYLPEKLRENEELGVDNDIMEFNLFEVKFKDESVKDEDN